MQRSWSRRSARCSSTTRICSRCRTRLWLHWSRKLVPADALVRHVVTFGRVLRQAGLEVGPGRLADALSGLDRVALERQDAVYWTLKQTLVSRQEDLDAFDRAFRAWFLRAPLVPQPRSAEEPESLRELKTGSAREATQADEGEGARGWSQDDVLRRKDFAEMTPEELRRLAGLVEGVAAERPRRRSRRLRAHHRGRQLDLRRLVRASLATGGDPLERAFRRRLEVPRKLVLLCDVSGSMEAYSRALLLFLHAVVGSGRGVEVFVFGTRLIRLTEEVRTRDPQQALAAAAQRVVDWASGTRIGASLRPCN